MQLVQVNVGVLNAVAPFKYFSDVYGAATPEHRACRRADVEAQGFSNEPAVRANGLLMQTYVVEAITSSPG